MSDELCPHCGGTGRRPVTQRTFAHPGQHSVREYKEIPHGTLTGYVGSTSRRGCSCDECRAAKRAYEAWRSRKKTGSPAKSKQH